MDYPGHCESMQPFFWSNRKLFNDSIPSFRNEPEFIFSIGAPEFAFYSSARQFVEMNALKLLYVEGGLDYANFSVGIFQMKPSFIETLEEEVGKRKELSMFNIILFSPEYDERQKRVERLHRLETKIWPFIYLAAFSEVLESIFGNYQFKSIDKKLVFFSAAYNYGMKSPVEEIIAWINKEKFPRGVGRKYSYSLISLEIFKILTE